jgi:hypothetical protein
MSVGIGAAMSLALQDTAIGMAIGFGVGIAFTYSDQTSCSSKKSNHESENK